VGCKAITPHLVGLAKRLEGKPFHLLAAHCQNQPKENVVSYIRGKGMAPDSPNMTVTSFGGHPQVKGNGYVPYYMVFDHTGKMVHHHMCGDYHGGDGLKMIEWVDDLLAKAPEIYVGDLTFERHGDLAEKIGAKKGFPGTVSTLETALAAEADDDELQVLHAALIRWRDQGLARADALESSDPKDVAPHLTALAKDLKGTELGAPVDTRLEHAKTSDDLKRAVGIAKDLDKLTARLEKLKPCKSCKRNGAPSALLSCSSCCDEHDKALASTAKKLDALAEKADGLRIAERVKAVRAELP
jgi:hypothetical protein